MSVSGPLEYSASLRVLNQSAEIPVNNPIGFELVFSDSEGTNFDPASGISITVDDPTGASTVYTLVSSTAISKYAVGVYSLTVEASIAGDWLARGQGQSPSGLVLTSRDSEVRIDATQVS